MANSVGIASVEIAMSLSNKANKRLLFIAGAFMISFLGFLLMDIYVSDERPKEFGYFMRDEVSRLNAVSESAAVRRPGLRTNQRTHKRAIAYFRTKRSFAEVKSSFSTFLMLHGWSVVDTRIDSNDYFYAEFCKDEFNFYLNVSQERQEVEYHLTLEWQQGLIHKTGCK